MTKKSHAVIVVIGDEVLNGSTLDTNSNWLCSQVAGRGGVVDAVITVHDDFNQIELALNFASRYSPDIIFTLGGLGPTADDLTLSAVSRALGVKLRLNSHALDIVNERYVALEAAGIVEKEISEEAMLAREKMARLPEGATALYNPVGAAPGVCVEVSPDTSILCLPGVPTEVKAIFEGPAREVILKTLGAGILRTATIITDTNDESVLAGPSERLAGEFRDIYVKTRPLRKRDGIIGITLTLSGNDETSVLDRLATAICRYRDLLTVCGVSIVNEEIS